jgi:hypothetical protein
MNDEPLYYRRVCRSLNRKVFRFSFYFIRLTESDALIAMGLTYAVALLIEYAGLKQAQFFGVSVDPVAWMGTGVISVLLLSLGNKLRPEGNSELILKGLFAKKLIVAHKKRGDRFWLPTNKRFYPNGAHTRRINRV